MQYNNTKIRLRRGLLPPYLSSLPKGYSFTRLNQTHVWNSRKFERVYNSKSP